MSLLAACVAFLLMLTALRWPEAPLAKRATAVGRFVVLVGGFGVAVSQMGAPLWAQVVPGVSAMVIAWTMLERRSVPGVLKNAIDHASRPYGQNSWAGKPAGVIGVSVGVIGTALAQQHLRSVLAILDVPTLGAPEVYLQWQEGLIDADGNIGANSRAFLQGWMDRFVAWVRLHNA